MLIIHLVEQILTSEITYVINLLFEKNQMEQNPYVFNDQGSDSDSLPSDDIVDNGLQKTRSLTQKKRQAEAIRTINNLCDMYYLGNSIREQLVNKFKQSRIKMNTEKWFDEQIQLRARQEIIRSIKNFILNYLEDQDNFSIQVLHNQLDLNCRIDIKDTIGYSKLGIMQINELSKAIYMNFNPNKFNQKNIPSKIQEMFQKLFNCLKFFLYKYSDDLNNPINEIDFIIFSKKYLKQKYKQLKITYKSKFKPILIGGLNACCYRFFRVLFQFFLSYSQLYLIPEILERNQKLWPRDESTFIRKILKNQIREKLQEIRDYEQKYGKQLEKQITNEMIGFQYENLYNHFCQTASTSKEQVYDSEPSLSLYRWEKITSEIFNVKKIQSSVKETTSSEPYICRYLYKGELKPKQKDSKNQQTDRVFQLEELRKKIKNYFEVQIKMKKLRQFNVFYALHQHFIIQVEGLDNIGKFSIVATNQQLLSKVKQFLEITCPQHEIKEIEQTFAVKGQLGLNILNLNQLVFAPCFVGKINVQTRKPQNHNKKPNQSNLNSNQKEVLSIIYKCQETIWNNKENILSKKKIKMTIQKDGSVMITHVTDFQFAKKQFENIKQQLINFVRRGEITIIKQNKRKQKLDSFADLTIIANPKNTNIKDERTIKDSLHYNDLTHRDTKTTGDKTVMEKDIPYQKHKKTLKVFTWNIMSYRKQVQTKSMKKSRKMSEDQQKRKMQQLQEQDYKRLKCIIEAIKQLDPDIICLQQPYYLYGNHRGLFEQLVGSDNNRYYYAQYSKDMGDRPPLKIDNTYCRNQRTMILSKFPVKFSHHRANYQSYNPTTGRNQSFKLSIIADFKIIIEPESQKQLQVLIASIHLKSHNSFKDNKIRNFQFEYLDHLSKKFDISILAGDFNTYDEPYANQLSTLSQFIQKDKNYTDIENYMVSKDATQRGYLNPTVTDKILIRFKDLDLKERLRVQDIKFPGCYTMQRFQGDNWRLKYNDGLQRTLSDHIGRYVQFGFKKQM